MSEEQREPAASDQPMGAEGTDQQTQESPALSVPPPAGGPGAPPAPAPAPATPFSPPAGGPGAPPPAPAPPFSPPAIPAPPATPPPPAIPPPPATAPELWSSPASPGAGAFPVPVPELDKAPRVETVPPPDGSPSAGGFDADRVIEVARTLTEKPEVLLGAAFGGGILLAIIIRRLGS